jgi:hypothetical protein
MSATTLEARVAALERTVTDFQQKLAELTGAAAPKRWWEDVGTPPMSGDEQKAFEEILEYGRYFRKTGKEPPPDWQPGNPVPESDAGE